MKTSPEIKNIAAALLAAQKEMPHPKKNAKNPHLRNSFADLNSVMDTTKPHLHKHGLVIFQTLGGEVGDGGTQYATCTTKLVHAESGEYFEDRQMMQYEAQKGLNVPQVFGVMSTYMKRYGWAAVCGINADSDDDGNESSGGSSNSKPNPTADLDL